VANSASLCKGKMQTIKVLPNPWSALDADGIPCGVCPRDPDADAGGPGQYVGARVDPKATEIIQRLNKGDDLRSPRQKTIFSFLGKAANDPGLREHLLSATPIDIPATKYYKERIAEGSIVCFDLAASKVARLANFSPPAHVYPLAPQPVAVAVAHAVAPEPAQESPAEEAETPEPKNAQQSPKRHK
jgi:hypothetical protein